ncbi:YgfZ/GcvT domain-containing protein [Nocardioides sp. Kera G14]|uniref:CAF17-like 4Fe-4S cluster assembly/insertion protein YgfZ n=1 Tax=Nocardioides sp. Kera G14 TaxID=2884264 RepID=UPI001D123DFD|nr:folate-binding protein [Nocardioides sp. Kera G14]UDY23134.1 folate-binding protein [Nocardioides sp. Kera G14]
MSTPTTTSPLLSLPGAVAGSGIDAAVPAHYGSFNAEQRRLVSGEGFVDLSHRDVLRVSGPDRLTWLHSLTSQAFEGLAPGVWTSALILSPQGHVEHFFSGVDDGTSFLAWTEPGRGAVLVAFLDRMKFWSDVTVTLEPATAVVWRPAGTMFVPRSELPSMPAALGDPAGTWAYDALRIERGEPRFGVDTDERTIPNEVGWLPGGPVSAVHLDKGCYRGQETVARVHTLGRPPRRLTLLHLDGSENRLPAEGSPIYLATDVHTGGSAAADEAAGASDAVVDSAAGAPAARPVGFVGSSARHHELGPIALGLVKRNVDVSALLSVDGMPVSQEILVDPEVGLHVRPLR